MPSVRQPASALADRAERHVFERLGALPAVERRVLALLDLAGADRAAAGRDTGLSEDELRQAVMRARRALRRTRAPLAAGARCEHAELLLCDRLDAPGAFDRHARKWLEIHLARCPRCSEHEALLAEAREALRASFSAVARPAPLPTPEQAGPPQERAKLRVVPERPALPPAPDLPALEGPDPRSTGPAEPGDRTADDPMRRDVSTRRSRAVSPTARRAARIVAILLVVAGILAALGLGLSALGGSHHQTAPWARPGAPEIHPAPLSGQ
jgi:hypothetical protein